MGVDERITKVISLIGRNEKMVSEKNNGIESGLSKSYNELKKNYDPLDAAFLTGFYSSNVYFSPSHEQTGNKLEQIIQSEKLSQIRRETRQVNNISILSELAKSNLKETMDSPMFQNPKYHGLTGLINYQDISEAIMNIAESKLKTGRYQVGVIEMDLNDLKKVNDSFGHSYGDELIIKAADMMAQAVKDSGYEVFKKDFSTDKSELNLKYFNKIRNFNSEKDKNLVLLSKNGNGDEYRIIVIDSIVNINNVVEKIVDNLKKLSLADYDFNKVKCSNRYSSLDNSNFEEVRVRFASGYSIGDQLGKCFEEADYAGYEAKLLGSDSTSSFMKYSSNSKHRKLVEKLYDDVSNIVSDGMCVKRDNGFKRYSFTIPGDLTKILKESNQYEEFNDLLEIEFLNSKRRGHRTNSDVTEFSITKGVNQYRRLPTIDIAKKIIVTSYKNNSNLGVRNNLLKYVS